MRWIDFNEWPEKSGLQTQINKPLIIKGCDRLVKPGWWQETRSCFNDVFYLNFENTPGMDALVCRWHSTHEDTGLFVGIAWQTYCTGDVYLFWWSTGSTPGIDQQSILPGSSWICHLLLIRYWTSSSSRQTSFRSGKVSFWHSDPFPSKNIWWPTTAIVAWSCLFTFFGGNVVVSFKINRLPETVFVCRWYALLLC